MTDHSLTWRQLRNAQHSHRLLLPGEKPGLSTATCRLALFLAAVALLGYVLTSSCVKELI